MSASTGAGKGKRALGAGFNASRSGTPLYSGQKDAAGNGSGHDGSDIPSGRQGRSLDGGSINTIIESEIIPRLLMAHHKDTKEVVSSGDLGGAQIEPSAAKKFAHLPMTQDTPHLLEEIDKFLADGVSVDAIYIDLLAPAARQLGEMWENDDCDFVDVTMGLWRLQEVMREIAERAPVPPINPADNPHRALFTPIPGDEHYFGAMMMDEVFARAGWRSQAMTKPLRRELLDIISREHFDLVGLTLTKDCPSAAAAHLIKAMRSVSANPNLSILVGGHMINQNPAVVAEVGADGTGADARAALEVARALVQSPEVRAHSLK